MLEQFRWPLSSMLQVLMKSFYLDNKGRAFWAIFGCVLVIGVGLLDALTGYELAFSLFYLIPCSLGAWYGGKGVGIFISIACALSWFAADTLTEHPYSHPAIPYWNTTIRFNVFLTVSLLISALRHAYENERKLARTDNLTGSINARFFLELLQMEIDRSLRNKQPFTIAYIDLDNFKTINDRYGHGVGDQVLLATVTQAKQLLRKIDLIARLGGDEFAFLLLETDQAEAKVAMAKVQTSLLQEMQSKNWPVTFSIGVLTCISVQQSAEALIGRADELMYTAKNSGKNAIHYATITDNVS